ncbi:hypothetical protein Ahy_A05g025212 isoform B [Arachis hypogaea]|uniref:2-phytyl-1,4-beta-naphthoquinone methyltransferase, chloroplastic n=1 Tax=Arachis hypogaea TaxID=3818 RepID=A0A445D842_ARAHY|nr:hypothetical protein Ahy_A05g025212 isoform B [Arachis hypogaea]
MPWLLWLEQVPHPPKLLLNCEPGLNKAKAGDHVLDICCGSGDLSFLLSQKVGSDGKESSGVLSKNAMCISKLSYHVTGLDFSKEQLLVASSKQHSKNCFSNIEWIEGDALDLPFSNGSFDAITMGYGLRNVVDRPKAMQEILRVLKAGSRVAILDFNKSEELLTSTIMEWMIDNVVVPVASAYGLSEDYKYLKTSIRGFLTGKELEKLALEVGFSSARHYELSGGLMGCLVAMR